MWPAGLDYGPILNHSLSWRIPCLDWPALSHVPMSAHVLKVREGGWLPQKQSVCRYQKNEGWIWAIKVIISTKFSFLRGSTSCLSFLGPNSSYSLLSINIFVFSPCLSSIITLKSMWEDITVSNYTSSLWPSAAVDLSCISQGRHSPLTPQLHLGSSGMMTTFQSRCLSVPSSILTQVVWVGLLCPPQWPPTLWIIEQRRGDSLGCAFRQCWVQDPALPVTNPRTINKVTHLPEPHFPHL